MVLGGSPLGKFYGFSNYPDCTATTDVDNIFDCNDGESFGLCGVVKMRII